MSEQSSAAANLGRFVAFAPDVEAAERVSAEAWNAGASGIEEREAPGGVELCIYAPISVLREVRDAVRADGAAARVEEAEGVPATDWSESWKQGLGAVEISPRLRLRPSFVEAPLAPGQCELVLDPAQAFGTGGHESTRLALAWIDALAPDLPEPCRVLDIGTGTGVLAFAAIRLADARAVAFDIDPWALAAARDNAGLNGIDAGLDLFVGSLDAVGGPGFDLVVANLSQRELMPLISGVAERTVVGGAAILSGLLRHECDGITSALQGVGFSIGGTREATDTEGNCWSALLMRRRDACAIR